jgi:adenylate cyclase
MEQLLANADAAFLEGERASISVLYTDMRNSTDLSERTEPELLVGFINDYLARMTEIVLAHEGTLDKFVGDAVMALFSAPIPQSDHALQAVRVGLTMQKAHQRTMVEWQARGIEPVPIGVGIATGELIVGEMGCEKRTDYTAIGRAANLGSRLCSVARGGQVIVSEATYDAIRDRVDATPLDGLRLKGVGREVTAYHVTALFD